MQPFPTTEWLKIRRQFWILSKFKINGKIINICEEVKLYMQLLYFEGRAQCSKSNGRMIL